MLFAEDGPDLDTLEREIQLYARKLLGNDFTYQEEQEDPAIRDYIRLNHSSHPHRAAADSNALVWYNELMTLSGAHKDNPARLRMEFERLKRRIIRAKYYGV